ncbi:MAG TPA: PhzF family phenazine biosynthesis protein [Acidimicrobiales bacterium]|jgi:PhzF family phenazine biosynthesis protein|nr:PhzF family phenazine biosynthesis protein [Acidimicrobiales bacterium]
MEIYQVDAFAHEPFRGNPAAVCLLEGGGDEAWMQSVAAEMNLAETAFLDADLSEPATYRLRWFTPTVEVDLCGHATLASAHVLWERGETANRLQFRTRSGTLTAARAEGGIQLDFPADPPNPVASFDDVAAAVGAEPVAVARGRSFYLAELADAGQVRSLTPDVDAIAALDAAAVIVTAAGAGEADFVSRFFAPRLGIAEDPVTGAAHCCLAPYWQGRLGRARLVGYQASARGGFVTVEVHGDRVLLTGQAVTVLRGELLA